jgi:hypothetical protein
MFVKDEGMEYTQGRNPDYITNRMMVTVASINSVSYQKPSYTPHSQIIYSATGEEIVALLRC